jgi:Coenzyme PQQ synthesis protein D (PqqD)
MKGVSFVPHTVAEAEGNMNYQSSHAQGVVSIMKISKASIIVAAKSQISADLSEEAVILNLESGIYYGLNEVGAFIWKLINEPMEVGEIQEAILKKYDVSPELCEPDLLVLLEDLAAHDLIEFKDGSNA